MTFRRSGANELKVKVRSECEGGVPVFDVESESENESD